MEATVATASKLSLCCVEAVPCCRLVELFYNRLSSVTGSLTPDTVLFKTYTGSFLVKPELKNKPIIGTSAAARIALTMRTEMELRCEIRCGSY